MVIDQNVQQNRETQEHERLTFGEFLKKNWKKLLLAPLAFALIMTITFEVIGLIFDGETIEFTTSRFLYTPVALALLLEVYLITLFFLVRWLRSSSLRPITGKRIELIHFMFLILTMTTIVPVISGEEPVSSLFTRLLINLGVSTLFGLLPRSVVEMLTQRGSDRKDRTDNKREEGEPAAG